MAFALMGGRCEVSRTCSDLLKRSKNLQENMESLKAAAALPKDHRPIERLGVMSQIEMYNFMRGTRVSALASFERGAKAHHRIAPFGGSDPSCWIGAEKRRIETETVPVNSFLSFDSVFGW